MIPPAARRRCRQCGCQVGDDRADYLTPVCVACLPPPATPPGLYIPDLAKQQDAAKRCAAVRNLVGQSMLLARSLYPEAHEESLDLMAETLLRQAIAERIEARQRRVGE